MSTFTKSIAIFSVATAALIVLITMAKTHHGIKAFFLTAVQGIAALFAVNVVGMATGVVLSVNQYTLGAGALFGTPGVISMLLLDVLFK